ncbi:hypothetical protein ABZZ36_41365 [Actinacidiphila glaucinigra]|uniref:hypothetical protein n=1 Tax=Actinacidiphila glaucinigra TaxID=235986 RepID=UPI0033B52217
MENGIDPGQAFVQLASPQGDVLVRIPRQLLAEPHRVVAVAGVDGEHVEDRGVDPITVIRVGDCQRGRDYPQPGLVDSPKQGLRGDPA